jgi:hypothetical protein
LITGGFSRPYKGLSICGDSFVVEEREGETLAAVIDGLGHGYESSVAAERAVEVIREFAALGVGPLMVKVHQELRTTRGAAVGLMKIDQLAPYSATVGLNTVTEFDQIDVPDFTGDLHTRLELYADPHPVLPRNLHEAQRELKHAAREE